MVPPAIPALVNGEAASSRTGSRNEQTSGPQLLPVTMRVLFVTSRYPSPANPGESPCIAEQKAAMEQLGYDVDVLLINSRRGKLNWLKAIGQIFWVAQIRKRYDLIHAHYGYFCGLVACMQIRVPVVVTYRGSDLLLRRERPISRMSGRLADGAIVMTRQMRDVLGRSDAQVVPYGIDLNVFHPHPRLHAREALGLPFEPPLVLFPYESTREVKRFDLVQAAMSLVRTEFPDVELVTIHSKPRESVAAYMSACDALVLASQYEGAPVAVREAMACNLPIVSVDVGNVREVIDGIDGCHLVSRDPRDIADKLALVLRTMRRTNGRAAAEAISGPQVARRIAAIYETLVGKKPVGHGQNTDPREL